ncbi:hypothetical protein P1X15_28830 [Runella sp. MFBS21]|uniref:hypothetical protein n=1 Tax=Runella sp. MFBS21 TaxID=3034018 RepID=UPI0023F75EA4|nr:hypothetical protein [Runella sp. MFBS21]MDF7821659.1 hypothetical protein [Runella sp. MFBS21]
MGANFGLVVAIGKPTIAKTFEEIVTALMPYPVIKSEEHHVDTRRDGNVHIVKTKEGLLEISSSQVTEKIFKNDLIFLDKLFNSLEQPPIILILQNYDYSNTFGYVIIENGNIVRKRRSSSGVLLENYGELLPCETILKNARPLKAVYNEDLDILEEVSNPDYDDEEIENAYKILGKKELLDEETVSTILLDKVMITYLGKDLWNWNPEIESSASFTYAK